MTSFPRARYVLDRRVSGPEVQLKLQAVLAGMDYAQVQAAMPEVWALAGAGLGFETFAAAVRARQEIEVLIRKLKVQPGSLRSVGNEVSN